MGRIEAWRLGADGNLACSGEVLAAIQCLLSVVFAVLVTAAFMVRRMGWAFLPGLASIAGFFAIGLGSGNSAWWTAVVFAAGSVLLATEWFLPGFGAAGLLGILAIMVSVLFATSGLSYFFLELAGSVGIGALWIPWLRRRRGGRGMPEAFINGAVTPAAGTPLNQPWEPSWIGRRGRALHALRPGGRVDFDGENREVISQDGYVPAGAVVEVVEVRAGYLVVRVCPRS